MSDEMPSADVLQRILNAVNETTDETRYDRLVADTYEALDQNLDALRADYQRRVASPDAPANNEDFYYSSVADASARLAMAEQQRIANLLTVALLSALVAVQTLGAGAALQLDARAPALFVAVVLFALKVPFVVVVFLAAVTAALIRLTGWG